MPDWREQDPNRGKLDKNAKQAWRQRLRRFMTRKRTRDDKQEPKVFTKRLLANKHHLLLDQALRVAVGFGLARFCSQVRLAALTEHEERYTVASESLPAHLRKTMPAHDMRSCILNKETNRTRLEAQWSTTRDCLLSHMDMGSIGWVEKHFVYRDIGCPGWWFADPTHRRHDNNVSAHSHILCSVGLRS